MVLLTEETGLSYFCLGLKITPLWFGLKLPEFLHKDQLKENKYIYKSPKNHQFKQEN